MEQAFTAYTRDGATLLPSTVFLVTARNP